MPSFPIVQKNTTTNTPGNTLTSPVTPGNILVAVWEAGTSTGGNPTIPTGVTDDNSNTYDLVGFTYDGNPPQATTAIYVCYAPVLTSHNPPTLSTSGATGVPSGGPSIFYLEMSVPANYTVSSAYCARNQVPGSPVTLSAGQMNGVGTTPISLTLLSSDSNNAYANSIAIFQNPFVDALVLFCDYDSASSSVTWSTSGTLVDQTAEAQSGTSGRSAALAYQDLTYTSMVCGYSGPVASCNGIQNGKLGVPYTWTLGVSGGTYPYTWAITAGSLPPGLSLSVGGVISGTPTTVGAWWFTATVTDANGMTASTTCAIGICGGGSSNLFF